MPDLRLLLVTGSTRHASTNTAALRAAAELLAPEVDVVLHDKLAELPAFDPDRDRDPLPEPVARLRDEIGRADGVVFCTPEYAGTLPGSLKNLLDWTVGGGELYGNPVTWINVAAPGRGSGADETLRTVLRYVGADLLPSSGVRVNVPRDAVDDDAEVHLSRSTLARRFSEAVGEPPLAYLARWRTQLAAHRLRATTHPVESIAHSVGYRSEYAFNRAFARHRGQPPGRYRRTARNADAARGTAA